MLIQRRSVNAASVSMFYRRGRTLSESAADLHGSVPFSVLAGEELVVSFQSVAFVTEVLDDRLLGEAVAGGGVAAVASVLWFGGGRTHWKQQMGDF